MLSADYSETTVYKFPPLGIFINKFEAEWAYKAVYSMAEALNFEEKKIQILIFKQHKIKEFTH